MTKYIIIEADTNDGDYITEKSVITDEQIQLILPIIEEINKNNGQYSLMEKEIYLLPDNNFSTNILQILIESTKIDLNSFYNSLEESRKV